MRTTLAIDDDVLTTARELASSRSISLGEVISSLVRQALQPTPSDRKHGMAVPVLPVGDAAAQVTSELVRQLEQELP